MKKKLALGGAVVLVLALLGVVVTHALRPEWFVRPLVKGECHRAASHAGTIVVAMTDDSVERRESPTTPMVIQRLDPGHPPVDLAHVYDVSDIAVTSSHVFYTLRGMLRPVTSIQAVPLAGGPPREIGTSEEYVKIAGAGDRVFWVTNKGALFSATAAGSAVEQTRVDPVRCIAPYSDGEIVAATSAQVFTTSDAIGLHVLIGENAFDGCSLTTYMGTVLLATWSSAGGTIRRLVPNETRWETVVSGRGKAILMRGTPNGLVWAEDNTTIFWLARDKPKKVLAYDGIFWLDADEDGHVLFQSVDGPIARIVW